MNGDEEFKDFLDSERLSVGELDEANLIIKASAEKMKAINKLFSVVLNSCGRKGITTDLEQDLQVFIRDLMKETKITLDNFDYALLFDSEDGETGNEKL